MKVDKILREKRRIIRWFLLTKQLKNAQATKVLRLILRDEELLRKISLVENTSKLPNAIIISAKGSNKHSFVYRVGEEYYYNVQDVVELLVYDAPREIYLHLSYDNGDFDHVGLHEYDDQAGYGFGTSPCINSFDDDNLDLTSETRENINQAVESIAESYEIRKKRVEAIWNEINQCLDNKNSNLFLQLTNELKKLSY